MDWLKVKKSSWETQRCGDIIDVRDGTHDTPKKLESGIPLITSKNLKREEIDFEDVTFISKEDFHNIEKRSAVDDGDILFGMIGTIGNPVVVNKSRPFAIKNVALFKFKDSKVHRRFFLHLLRSNAITSQLERNSRGGNQKFVSLRVLRNLRIPLPPLEEQRRIAAILDKADEVGRETAKIQEMRDEIIQAMFLDIFGDPITNHKGWRTISGSDLFNFSSGKYNPTKNLSKQFDYPTYGGNGITGYSQDFLIDYETIVIGRVGAYCGSVHKTESKVWITDNAIYIKEFKKEINQIFVYYAYQNYKLNRFADFSGQPKITQGPLKKMMFIYPPIEHQNQFADIVRHINSLDLSALETQATTLKAALSQELLS